MSKWGNGDLTHGRSTTRRSFLPTAALFPTTNQLSLTPMSIASRVKALEEAAAASQSYQKPPANLSPRTSLTFSSDDALTAASSSAPASPRANSVLEDLDSFVLTGPPSSSPSPTSFSSKPQLGRPSHKAGTPPPTRPLYPLISLVSPPRSTAPVNATRKEPGTMMTGSSAMTPPLPPRRQPSSSSLRSTPTLLDQPSSSGLASSDSLTIDQPFTIVKSATRHAHASSASSFHSLSLSDGGDKEPLAPLNTGSSSGVYATASANDGKPPKSPFGVARKAPPPIPDRPSRHASYNTTPTSSSNVPIKGPGSMPSSPMTNPPYQVRRQPPAPPPRAPASSSPSSSKPSSYTTRKAPPPPLLDLSSSTTSTISPLASPPHRATKRKTPVPQPARLRYEELFDKQRKLLLSSNSGSTSLGPPPLPARPQRTHVGWRGTSIDLRTTGPTPSANNDNSQAATLPGQSVRRIWTLSKLDKKILREIWWVIGGSWSIRLYPLNMTVYTRIECDASKTGSLDREAFVQGMWRIDEELSKKASSRKGKAAAGATLNLPTPYTARR